MYTVGMQNINTLKVIYIKLIEYIERMVRSDE